MRAALNMADDSITGCEYRVNHNDTGTGDFSGWGPWTAIPDSGANTTSHSFSGLNNGSEYRPRRVGVRRVDLPNRTIAAERGMTARFVDAVGDCD